MEKYDETFIIESIKDLDFTKDELLNIGIVFFDDLSEIEVTVKELLGLSIDTKEIQLIDVGLALTQVGTVGNPTWAIHKHQISNEFICDVFNKRNFYSISVSEYGEEVEVVEKAHLRDDNLEDDLLYYLEDALFGAEDEFIDDSLKLRH